jgi:hypothetical protein
MNATVLTESCKVALDDKKSGASYIISDADDCEDHELA